MRSILVAVIAARGLPNGTHNALDNAMDNAMIYGFPSLTSILQFEKSSFRAVSEDFQSSSRAILEHFLNIC